MGREVVRLEEITEEEKLVAELDLLGIRYLSRQTTYRARRVRPPESLLADLIRQPSARVRAAAIAVLLSHPEYADAVPAALEQLDSEERLTLRSFYAASVLLQLEYADRLRSFQAAQWRLLPKLPQAMDDLNLPTQGTPRARLSALGEEQRRRTRTVANWAGTYEQVAGQLLRQWETDQSEAQQSPALRIIEPMRGPVARSRSDRASR